MAGATCACVAATPTGAFSAARPVLDADAVAATVAPAPQPPEGDAMNDAKGWGECGSDASAVALAPEGEDKETRQRRFCWVLRELRSFALLMALVAAGLVYQRQLSDAAQRAINALRSLPLVGSVFVIFLIHVLRKLLPPLYFLFPFSTAVAFFLAVRLVLPEAVLATQLLALHGILVYPALPRLYADVLDRVCSHHPAAAATTAADAAGDCLDRCIGLLLPRSLRLAIQALDSTWRDCVKEAAWYRQLFAIVTWGNAEGINDGACILWFACRGEVPWTTWTVGRLLAVVLEVPKATLRLRLLGGLAEGAAEASISEIVEALQHLPRYEVFAVVLVTGSCTLYVQSTNLLALLRLLLGSCRHCRSLRRVASVEVST